MVTLKEVFAALEEAPSVFILSYIPEPSSVALQDGYQSVLTMQELADWPFAPHWCKYTTTEVTYDGVSKKRFFCADLSTTQHILAKNHSDFHSSIRLKLSHLTRHVDRMIMRCEEKGESGGFAWETASGHCLISPEKKLIVLDDDYVGYGGEGNIKDDFAKTAEMLKKEFPDFEVRVVQSGYHVLAERLQKALDNFYYG